MRQQYRNAFRQLLQLHHCQPSNQLKVFCRRLALSHSQVTSYSVVSHRSSNNNQPLPLISTIQHNPPQRCYSKFSTHLSTERAMELICHLDPEERENLRNAMGKLLAEKEKKLYESQLAVGSWRTRFGRLSNKPALGQVDPSGSFCAMPEDWVKKKMVESAAPPTTNQLCSIFFVNAVPFIAFGFLDNFIMIMAGEYIEFYLGHFITVSTMAAAGLGNTISDILGIITATYVENACHMLGLKQPRLTAAQFELKSSKRAASWGRIMGITLGCLLGMCPLWMMKDEENKDKAEQADKQSAVDQN